MTEEQYKTAIQLREKINSIKRVVEIINNTNCKIIVSDGSNFYNVKDNYEGINEEIRKILQGAFTIELENNQKVFEQL